MINNQRGVMLSVGVATLMVLLLATWSSAWATPSQDALHQTVPTPAAGQSVGTITPTEAGELRSPDDDVVITVPSGAVDETINLVYSAKSASEAPSATAGFRFTGHVFTLEVFRDLSLQPGFTFAKAITICLNYTEADLAEAGYNTARFVIQTYDSETGQWVDLVTTVDTTKMQACAQITHTSWFVLAIKPSPSLTPTPAAPTAPPKAGSGGIQANLPLGELALGAALLGATSYFLLRRRRPSSPHR